MAWFREQSIARSIMLKARWNLQALRFHLFQWHIRWPNALWTTWTSYGPVREVKCTYDIHEPSQNWVLFQHFCAKPLNGFPKTGAVLKMKLRPWGQKRNHLYWCSSHFQALDCTWQHICNVVNKTNPAHCFLFLEHSKFASNGKYIYIYVCCA